MTLTQPAEAHAVVPTAAPRRRKVTRLTRSERAMLVGGLVPTLAWLAFAQGYPLLDSLYLSFQKWSLVNSDTPQGFAGLANYEQVLTDPQFLHGLRLSGLFVASVAVELVAGFALAYFTLGEGRRMQLLRTTLLIPMVMAPIAVGTLWRLLLDPNSGLVDKLLAAVGLGHPDWLGGQNTAVVAVIGVDVWEWIPFAMIIYSAAMSGIDPTLVESARIDGASAWQAVRRIFLPLTAPATTLICVFRLIDAFLVIDVVYSMVGGGPGFATTTSTLWVYRNGLKYFNISEAAAASWVMLVICVVAAAVLLWVKGRVERRISGE